MSDDNRMEIAPLGDRSGFVTYSRVEPRRQTDEQREAPILTGIEVPDDGRGEGEFEAAPDVRATPRVAPARPRGRRALGIFAVVALVAFAGGVGVLAGSFVFPTVGKVIPVPGGGKAAVVAADTQEPATPEEKAEPQEKAVPQVATRGPDVDRFAVLDEPVAPAVVEPKAPAIAAAPAKTEIAAGTPPVAERPPVPRSRPERAPPALTVEQPDPLATPDAARPDAVAAATASPAPAFQAPVAEPQPQAQGEAPLPPLPEAQADASIDPLAPPEVLVPDDPASAEARVPPADIPEEGGVDASHDMSVADAGAAEPAEAWNEPYQSALDRWVVLGVRDGRAVIDGRERGVFMVVEGSEIPGVGIVEDIRRRHGRWAVVTSGGSIFSVVDRDDRRRFWLSRLLR